MKYAAITVALIVASAAGYLASEVKWSSRCVVQNLSIEGAKIIAQDGCIFRNLNLVVPDA